MKDIDKIGRLEQYRKEFEGAIQDPDMLAVIASSSILNRIEEPTIRLKAAMRLGFLCEEVHEICAGRYRQVLDLDVFNQLNIEELVLELTNQPYNLRTHGLEKAIERVVIKLIKVRAGCHLDKRGRALPPNLQEQGKTTTSSKRLRSDYEN